MASNIEKTSPSVAIIGMAGRFPGAANLRQFWNNLRDGVESLSLLTDEEILATGVSPELLADPNYVKKATILENAGMFDAEFFGFNPREAEIIDPQHRVFLECAWEALEDAGYASDLYQGSIGVYAGASMNSYLIRHLLANRSVLESVGAYQVMLGNDKDFLATRVSYKLNLRGPSITVQTACSTSLVAIQHAWRSLLNNQCDIALAGGVCIGFPQNAGYLYTDGMIFSPDGHCRPFDEKGKGIRAGAGAGIIVMKRLADAIADRDQIRAVICGAAINNDGSRKMGYTAPSVDGQAEAIAMAQSLGGTRPETISYIEAHGTATPIGDPIEMAALTQAFGDCGGRKQFCAIGSVKSNLGHLDAAAGVAGVVKTVLALQHGEIPPTLHYQTPNPHIDFANSPFYVNDKLTKWEPNGAPRRAGVSSFGIGGTNAHIVLQEAPAVVSKDPQKPAYLLTLSARNSRALEAATDNLADFFEEHPGISLANACYTLQAGRKKFEHRRIAVCRDRDDAIAVLRKKESPRVITGTGEDSTRDIVFLFSGQGSQYPGMGSQLYKTVPVFREHIDYCAEKLIPLLSTDIRRLLFPADGDPAADLASQLNQTRLAQPALFAVEYSLARMWMHWNVVPKTMIGHSIGEYAAAAIAGVFSLDDAIRIVALRGQLMQEMPPGRMLAVQLPEKELRPMLQADVEIAAVNAPSLCTVTGPISAIDMFEKHLADRAIEYTALHTSHAFHSAMMDPMLKRFEEEVKNTDLKPPRIPIISNLSGTMLSAEDAVSPGYWARHLRHTVHFSDGIREILRNGTPSFLETGPGNTLCTFAQICGGRSAKVYSSLPHPRDRKSDYEVVLDTLGRLWLQGISPNWAKVHEGDEPSRISLPAYPFERQMYWVEPKAQEANLRQNDTALGRSSDISKWFYVPSWKRSVAPKPGPAKSEQETPWIIFCDAGGVGRQLGKILEDAGRRPIFIDQAPEFRKTVGGYQLAPGNAEHFNQLAAELKKAQQLPCRIVYAWNIDVHDNTNKNELLDIPYYSLVYLIQTLGEAEYEGEIRLLILGRGMQSVLGTESLQPEKATSVALCKTIPIEYTQIGCKNIDIEKKDGVYSDTLLRSIINELHVWDRDRIIAYRGTTRWIQTYEQLLQPPVDNVWEPLPDGGVCLITGGLGGMALTFAKRMASLPGAKIALLSHTGMPPRAEWPNLMAAPETGKLMRERIEALLEIESKGADYRLVEADVTDANSMRAALASVKEKLGEIRSVIHSAGVLGAGYIHTGSRSKMEQVLAPKIHGTMILRELLGDSPLKFFLLCSSTSTILPTPGAADYSAANAFMDAFASQRHAMGDTSVVSVNWDLWQKVGIGVRVELPPEWKQFHEETLKQGILPEEGARVLPIALGLGLPQVAIVPRNLHGLINQAVKADEVRGPETKGSEKREVDASLTKHTRPDVSSTYAQPGTETERQIAAIWEEIMGIQGIGIHDDYFELGGHSLAATQLLGRIRTLLGVDLPIRQLFESRTVAGLSEVVESVLWRQSAGTPSAAAEGDREEFEL